LNTFTSPITTAANAARARSMIAAASGSPACSASAT
jgi:hypothetical protein